MRASISLGRIAGIKVGVNASVFLILAILVGGLATGQLPAAFPGHSVAAYVIAAIIAAVLFSASLLAHELAHSRGGAPQRHRGRQHRALAPWWRGPARGRAEDPGADFRIAVVGPLTSLALAVVFGLGALGLHSWAPLG